MDTFNSEDANLLAHMALGRNGLRMAKLGEKHEKRFIELAVTSNVPEALARMIPGDRNVYAAEATRIFETEFASETDAEYALSHTLAIALYKAWLGAVERKAQLYAKWESAVQKQQELQQLISMRAYQLGCTEDELADKMIQMEILTEAQARPLKEKDELFVEISRMEARLESHSFLLDALLKLAQAHVGYVVQIEENEANRRTGFLPTLLRKISPVHNNATQLQHLQAWVEEFFANK